MKRPKVEVTWQDAAALVGPWDDLDARVQPVDPYLVWRWLEAQPGFNEAVERGEREIAEGKGVSFKNIRAESYEIKVMDP